MSGAPGLGYPSQVLQHAERVPAVLSARQKQLVELLADEWDL
ncbi:hypothetical protein [Streptomyces sp. NPDC059262]